MNEQQQICEDFLEGINEIYEIMFTQECLLYLLDSEKTVVNDIYLEAEKRVYKPPLKLSAKIQLSFEKEELPDLDMKCDAIVTIPTKQLIINKLDRESFEDLEVLKSGMIGYKEISNYEILKIIPKTLVANEWQFYVFYCRIPPVSVPPEFNEEDTKDIEGDDTDELYG